MNGVDLSSIGCRAQIEFCIDAFAQETGYVSASARQISNPMELPPRLERLVSTLETAAGWRAWEERGRGWFIQGRLIRAAGAPCDSPTAHLIFRDHKARTITAGIWWRSAPAQWDLVQVLTEFSEAPTA